MLPTDEPLSHLGPSLLLLLQLQLLLAPASAFFPNIWSLLAAPGSITHQDLTEEAALNVTLQLFLEQPPPGRPPLRLEDFLGRTLLADNLFAAYFGPGSPSRRFRAALGEVSRANAAQDFLPTSRNDPDLHFDAERLGQGRARLVGALGETVVAARALDHSLARQRLGAALHALQVRTELVGCGQRGLRFQSSCLLNGASLAMPPPTLEGAGALLGAAKALGLFPSPRLQTGSFLWEQPGGIGGWSRISTVTATGWNWGSSSHTLTSSGQGRGCGTWRKWTILPAPTVTSGAALGICWASHSSPLATLELIPPNLQIPFPNPGKCSHGGHFDQSSSQPPRGGINKDSTSPGFSPHHMLHLQAANLALLASIQAFSLLRSRLGDRGFSRLLDITPASSLSFVLDTTGSMGEEINAAKIQARHIVEQRRGGPMEPTHYVLVPFHDPGFGPVFTTSDPDSFWQQLNEIHALGGGDEPEMCLSALELALQHTPPLSDIFVFTDASPKDAFLTNRVESLTQERRCRVTFLLTEDPSRVQGRPRREVLSPLRFEPYEAVALASGGEVIFTKDQYIQDVAAIVGDSVADLVTLPLEPPVVVPERPLVFSVDGLLQRVTVRIHGEVSSFWIRNPAGVSQGQEEGEGPLGHTRRFGQFWMVRMNDPLQTGTWEIQVTAKGTPRVRVQAQTSLDFLFHFGIPMEDGPHPGLYPLTQPVAGLQTQLLVEVTGLGSRGNPGDPLPHFSHVVLRGVPHGAELGRVPLEPMGPRERGLLAASLPPTLLSTAGPFSLELIGQDGVGQGLHRVAPQPCAVVPVLLEWSPGFPGAGHRGPAQPPHCQLLGPSGSRS
ncbi:von Willebrand factor A domain-containing protein 7 isoform X5 [Lagenorhynchus albirostris]|uniref:von Willebrand factor A domain-containing protein 7 isoform X5 n=1 Tax=Lagenorhynchus albirostris TaxID=27610 RepID=UPI0028E822B5|nr:von Willebrand factor A domain-containing protein 7 isoform X5 [Lagenorhynchus albirostris]